MRRAIEIVTRSEMFGQRKVDLGKRLIREYPEDSRAKSGTRPGDFDDDGRTRASRVQFIPVSQRTGAELQRVVGPGFPHFRKILVGLSIPPKDREHGRTSNVFPAISQ